jgi:inhibitor of cysteine peptidase
VKEENFEGMFMKRILKAISLILFVAAVVFAAGCAQKPATPGNETITPGNGTLSPANETVTQGNGTTENGQVVTENDSGKTINLKNKENFTLNLKENPTTGYSWQLNLSKGLSILSDEYTQDKFPDEKGAPEGRGGIHSWVIQGTAPGSQQVNGIYKRSWENTTGTEQNFTLNVEVI